MGQRSRSAVAVRVALRDVLARATGADHRLFGASPTVWLTAGGDLGRPVVEVRIGSALVGELDDTASARWGAAVAHAASAAAWLTAESFLRGTGTPGDPWLLRLLLPRDGDG